MTVTSEQRLRVFIAGHRGMVGQALVREFSRDPSYQLVTADRAQLDLCDQRQVRQFFAREKPDWVLVAAARVGGIIANQQHPAQFITENLQIAVNLIETAHQHHCQRLLYLGSSCIYPKMAPQPIREEALLSGALEPTNDAYAIAKIAGLRLCQAYQQQFGADFRALMPTNLYGPGDNFEPEHGHVIPALLQKFYQAAQDGSTVSVWGSGKPLREFLHVDDLARACRFVMELSETTYRQATAGTAGFLNVGSGEETSIAELAALLAALTGYRQPLCFDSGKPDGTPRKLLDSSRLQQLGWQPAISLATGLAQTLGWYLQQSEVRQRRIDTAVSATGIHPQP